MSTRTPVKKAAPKKAAKKAASKTQSAHDAKSSKSTDMFKGLFPYIGAIQAPQTTVEAMTEDEWEAVQGLLRQPRRQKEDGTNLTKQQSAKDEYLHEGIKVNTVQETKHGMLSERLVAIIAVQWRLRELAVRLYTATAKITGDTQEIKLDEPAVLNKDNQLATLCNVQSYNEMLRNILEDVAYRLEDITN